MLSDFHEVTSTAGHKGDAASAGFSRNRMVEPEPPGSSCLPRSRPAVRKPQIDHAGGSHSQALRLNQELLGQPPAAVYTLTAHPALQLQPMSEGNDMRPEPETPSKIVLIETMRGDEMTAVDIKQLNSGAIC